MELNFTSYIFTELDFNPKKISGVLSSLIDVSGHLVEHDPSKYHVILISVFHSFFYSFPRMARLV